MAPIRALLAVESSLVLRVAYDIVQLRVMSVHLPNYVLRELAPFLFDAH